jgi:hypothetical protein
MAVKVFLTGTTGYIAGDALSVLHSKHPEYEYTALVRTKDKATLVEKAYPQVRTVLGDLDDSELLQQEASRADVVLRSSQSCLLYVHADLSIDAADASDHEGAAKAIAAGIVKGHSKEHPGYWLHTGGTGILTWEDSESDRLGEWSDKEYNDWTAVEDLTNLPDSAFHRNVDKIVIEAGEKHSDVLKTAIVCPPTIYGAFGSQPSMRPQLTRCRSRQRSSLGT